MALGNMTQPVCMYSAYPTDTPTNVGDAFVSPDFGKISASVDYKTPALIGKNGDNLKLNKEIVAMTSLDEMLAGFQKRTCSVKFMKIDVQGVEKFVLEGARAFLKHYRPVMIIEFEDQLSRMHGYTMRETISLLHELQYTVLFLEHTYPSDHVCVPNEKLLEFTKEFNDSIKPLETDNEVNHNLENGVVYRLVL
jgi:hypothetical protein